MDILDDPLNLSASYACAVANHLSRVTVITSTNNLEEALTDAFVITAIEKTAIIIGRKIFTFLENTGQARFTAKMVGQAGFFTRCAICHQCSRLPAQWSVYAPMPC